MREARFTFTKRVDVVVLPRGPLRTPRRPPGRRVPALSCRRVQRQRCPARVVAQVSSGPPDLRRPDRLSPAAWHSRPRPWPPAWPLETPLRPLFGLLRLPRGSTLVRVLTGSAPRASPWGRFPDSPPPGRPSPPLSPEAPRQPGGGPQALRRWGPQSPLPRTGVCGPSRPAHPPRPAPPAVGIPTSVLAPAGPRHLCYPLPNPRLPRLPAGPRRPRGPTDLSASTLLPTDSGPSTRASTDPRRPRRSPPTQGPHGPPSTLSYHAFPTDSGASTERPRRPRRAAGRLPRPAPCFFLGVQGSGVPAPP